jgi:hypothetical protein
MMMKLALLLFLLGFTFTTARLDQTSLITELLSTNGEASTYDVKSKTSACCNACPCTRSIPPQCLSLF